MSLQTIGTRSAAASRLGIAFDDDSGLGQLLTSIHIRFEFQGEENRVYLSGPVTESDVDKELRARR